MSGTKLSLPSERRRKRSSVACETCHARKVRCNLSVSGFPCTNCSQDDIECKIYTRPVKRVRVVELKQRPPPVTHSEQNAEDVQALPSPMSQPQCSPSSTTAENAAGRCHNVNEDYDIYVAENNDTKAGPQGNSILAANTALGENVDRNSMPYFMGEALGLEFVLNICQPERANKGYHHPVPPGKQNLRRYLSSQNPPIESPAPPIEIGEELIRCFFHYVYPVIPILDATSFLQEHSTDSQFETPSLLLWSVYFTAAYYIDKSKLAAAGYESRKSFSLLCYKKAKRMYNSDEELDKLTLLQSVCLLSFRYLEPDDRTDAWHWNGVAISLCQGMGLHRKIETIQYGSHESPFGSNHQSLWRLIWWSCFFRETWLALSYGRPMRVNLDDCDTPMPSQQDFLTHIYDNVPNRRRKLLSVDFRSLASCYVRLINLTIKLSRLLSTHYRPKRDPPIKEMLAADEEEIVKNQASHKTLEDNRDTVVRVHNFHFQLLSEAAIIVLYRPYLLTQPDAVANSPPDSIHSIAHRKVNAAAANCSSMLNQLTSMDWVKFCQPTVITAISSAMQVYFLNSTLGNSLARRRASSQLDLFMLVLEEMQDTYWSACLIYEVFKEGRKVLENHMKSRTSSAPVQSHVVNPAPSYAFSAGSTEPALDHYINSGNMPTPGEFSHDENWQDTSNSEWDFDLGSILNSTNLNFTANWCDFKTI